MKQTPTRTWVYGVDFSGATDAGRKIWVAGGRIVEGTLHLNELRRAEALPGSSRMRNASLTALRTFIAESRDAVFGMDFPLGLPLALLQCEDWETYIRAFPKRFTSAENFRAACQQAAAGRELKRRTDIEARTPFAAYNLRLYRQTYYGLAELVAPLVHDVRVCVLPMQSADPDRPWMVEICPASTLKQQQLYQPYKGRTLQQREQRATILNALKERILHLHIADSVEMHALADSEGDALDSVIAATAAFRAYTLANNLLNITNKQYLQEGYVYV